MELAQLTRARHWSLALIGLLFCACNTSTTSESGDTDTLEVADVFSDTRNSTGTEGTLDYTGKYTGMLPCADCAGIKTEILVSEGTYIKRTIYLGDGRPDRYEARGGATWDNDTRILTLGGITPPNRYIVDKNTLTQLDRQGRKVTGRMASRYILRKE